MNSKQRSLHPAARRPKFRAVYVSRDGESPLPWRVSKCAALNDVNHNYSSVASGYWRIERSDGRRIELTERQYQNARACHWYSQLERSVWG